MLEIEVPLIRPDPGRSRVIEERSATIGGI